ncbi:MAG: methyltransferase RsmF C-terminal domain-like protein, partial [Bacteroidales bacterium]
KFIAIPKAYMELYKAIQSNLRIVKAGIDLATLKGKDLIPEHALAMSTDINCNKFHIAEVNRETALQYLRKEAMIFDENMPKGYILIACNNHILGWMKNIGNRANNLYPQEWRIRSAIK